MFCGLETGTQKTQHSALSNWREHGMKDPEKMPTNGKEIWYCQDGAELHEVIQFQGRAFQEI